MGAKKYTNLFGASPAKKKSPSREKSKLQEVNNATTKQEVEQLKAIINTKLKSPDMAKKAAEILKNWGLRD